MHAPVSQHTSVTPHTPHNRAGKRFDPLGFTKPKGGPTASPSSPEQLPGLGVFAPWLGGLAGWLAGGWWFEQREMTQV
jgi:predicted lipid-binding transport protein (Tim44 family)